MPRSSNPAGNRTTGGRVAVVADGAEARNITEAARTGDAGGLPYWAALHPANGVLTASGPAPDLGRLVGELRAPALLIAAGRGQEARFFDTALR
jgi:hypothetical protein